MRATNWFVILGTVGCALVCVSLMSDGVLRSTNADETATEPETDAAGTSNESKSLRTRSGLLALYDFSSPSGLIVKDRSGVGKPVDLRITNPKAVHRSKGSLEVRGKTLIRSDKPATRITEAIRRSGEITIEAWIRPAKTNLTGPARIVTLSKNGNERSFTLGQDGDRFDVRFRTTKTSANGIPSLSSPKKSLTTRKTHVVYTRDRSGRARIFVNGKRSAERTVFGATRNWKRSFRLALANELSNDRPWQGTYYLVAIYNRDLSPGEIQQNFKAGAEGLSAPQLVENKQQHLFETQIAPLLAKHCLDCHDSASKKGRLDLSRKGRAFAGGESGKAIVPGKAAKSLLWEQVASDEMPKDQPPLSPREKTVLREWIDAGAVWSLERIDQANYAHEGRNNEIVLQRLTVPEYIETVRSAVGVDIAKEARETLPPDLRADGFSNTAYNLNVDLKHVEVYARLAETIVTRMDVMKFAAKFSKSRKLSTDDTMRQFVAKLGKWLLRGPLDDHEVTTYSGIATTVASAGGTYKEAVSYIIEAMLQSPRFI
ncbi:MAG: DUF1587 domain-containing protein, partial [Planctomycetes bacterium]|nr:DUF1587 domain-containing protein [Planctomycetota bacterium]